MEGEGYIRLSVKKRPDCVVITVKDNGKGMEPEKIRVVLDHVADTHNVSSDSTGIGLNNVRSRMELYYNRTGLLQISSGGLDQGTAVTLTIPLGGG